MRPGRPPRPTAPAAPRSPPPPAGRALRTPLRAAVPRATRADLRSARLQGGHRDHRESLPPTDEAHPFVALRLDVHRTLLEPEPRGERRGHRGEMRAELGCLGD